MENQTNINILAKTRSSSGSKSSGSKSNSGSKSKTDSKSSTQSKKDTQNIKNVEKYTKVNPKAPAPQKITKPDGKAVTRTEPEQPVTKSGFDNRDEVRVREHTTVYYRDNGLDPIVYMGAGYLLGNAMDGDKEIPCVLEEPEKKEGEASEVQRPDLPLCNQVATTGGTGCVWIVGLLFMGASAILTVL